jgi:hypothetical protein
MLTEAERDRLTGTFNERLKIATVAMAPSLVMFNDNNSSGDAALVDEMCPSDYELRLWRFIVEHHARKQIRSDAFGDAYGRAEAKIVESTSRRSCTRREMFPRPTRNWLPPSLSDPMTPSRSNSRFRLVNSPTK